MMYKKEGVAPCFIRARYKVKKSVKGGLILPKVAICRDGNCRHMECQTNYFDNLSNLNTDQ